MHLCTRSLVPGLCLEQCWRCFRSWTALLPLCTMMQLLMLGPLYSIVCPCIKLIVAAFCCLLLVVCCVQKRAARLCFTQQSSYELGTLAYRIITGSAVVQGADLPSIPDLYPLKLHILLPRLVATDPGTAGCEQFGCRCPLVHLSCVYYATSPLHALHALRPRDLLCCSSSEFVRVTVPPVCVLHPVLPPCIPSPPVCVASQPLEWPWTLLWAPCQSCWALLHHQSPSAQVVPRYVQQVG